MSRLSDAAPAAAADTLRKGLAMIAVGQLRPDVTIVEFLDSVAAIHDLLAAGRGNGKYVARVAG